MYRSAAAALMMVVMSVAAPVMAQSDKQPDKAPTVKPAVKPDGKPEVKPSVDPTKSPKLTPATEPAKEDKSKEPVAKFPQKVEKKLYAKNDFRGKKAPEFKVEKWLGKEPVRKDKVVLIDFWATWCPPCKALIPELEQFQEKFKDDLVVIGVSDEKFDVVQKYIKDQRNNKIGYGVAVDSKRSMYEPLGISGIPHVLIIDRDGIVRWQGFPGESKEPLTEAIVKQIIDADKAAHTKKKPSTGDKEKSEPKKNLNPDVKTEKPKKEPKK